MLSQKPKKLSEKPLKSQEKIVAALLFSKGTNAGQLLMGGGGSKTIKYLTTRSNSSWEKESAALL